MTKPTEIRSHVLANLDHYLAELDKQLTAQGGTVVYLRGADEVADYLELLTREREIPVPGGAESLRRHAERIEPGVEAYLRGESPADTESLELADGALRISAAAFLIADAGAICLTGEHPGGTGPKIQVVVAGIEKVLPRMRDLAVFLPLLPSDTTRFLTGPRRAGELDGPEELCLILVDGGRSELLASPERRDLLRCVRCGACLPGRAGGGGVDCPVGIDTEGLPLRLREEAPLEVGGWKFRLWGYVMRKPRLYEFAGQMLRAFWRDEWGLPAPPAKSFRQAWREGKK
jgi:hypothetical protein